MRLTQKPPSFQGLLSDLPKLLSKRVFSDTVITSLHGPRYHHWDKLRFLPPPDGLTHEEWWLALKLARRSNRRTIPLKATDGTPFSYVVTEAVEKALHEASLALGGKLKLSEPVTNPHTRDQYLVSSLIEEAITSSQLEGAAATRKIAEEMLRSGHKPRNVDETMILNNFLAMRRINELENAPLSPELIFELHSILCDKTLPPENCGRLRRPDEPDDDIAVYDNLTNEVIHRPPPARELPKRLREMCSFANGETHGGFVHPITRAIVLHFWLAYDHPFVDGNGRTARALFYWAMKAGGFWLAEYVSISSIIRTGPAKYIRAFLETQTDDNDLTYFLLYHLGVLERAVKNLESFIERKREEVARASAAILDAGEFNHRQRELLLHASKHPGQEYTIKSHRNSHRVAYATARADLLALVQRGLLTQKKRGKAMVFKAAPDLAKLLKP